MARTQLTATALVPGGGDISASAANVDGHSFLNTGHQLLYISNGDGSATTITFQTPLQIEGQDVAEVTDSLGAGASALYGIFSNRLFNQATGEVYVDFSKVTSLTVQLFEF